ncbi:MAG TPA: MiaB/RimO family radical SAM methylthiotransferase, partial [Candidatus Krumholzibacterium sp.]|nr:MiaB/RimO family radical SAM methylthiotransferase [Candidatus Krumholzibacterium sp.]
MKKAYYESFGCQMNAYDTEVIESLMAGTGFMTVEDPAEADLILVNTCSVRENAEQRAIGRLNDLSRHRKAVLGVCGCMAQRMGAELFDSVPHLSIIAGPDNYLDLPGAVLSAIDSGKKVLLDSTDGNITYGLGTGPVSDARISRFLSITRGCENFCTYCIVPYLRGPVRSKDPGQIVKEIELLAGSGTREITLLGQNVMAYRSGEVGFYGLVRTILERTEIRRVRFLTTHPRDLDERIFRLMNEDERFCPHIHLPVQSGSDRILGLMNRGYTKAHYLGLIAEARKIRPDLAVST